MKILTVFFLSFIILFVPPPPTDAEEWTPECRHDVLYCMSVVGEYYRVRAVRGLWWGRDHVEAQALMPSERGNFWEWRFIRENEHGNVEPLDVYEIEGFNMAKRISFEEYLDLMTEWVKARYNINNYDYKSQ